MKLKYHDLISRNPIIFPNVGSIKCPLLSEVDALSFDIYYSLLNSLLITPEDYFENLEKTLGIEVPLEVIIETKKFDLVLTDDRFKFDDLIRGKEYEVFKNDEDVEIAKKYKLEKFDLLECSNGKKIVANSKSKANQSICDLEID